MNILYLYNATQTYTVTVFEHLSSFKKYSAHFSFFAHQDQYNDLSIDFSFFDAVVIHYTIRLPFDQISQQNAAFLAEYQGLKVLFIQDEYDHTHQVWDWIKKLGIQLVFTVVPPEGVSKVYPPEIFRGVRFVSVLTGYVPENIPPALYRPPSKRDLVVGYRGRSLPIRYGTLGQEKINIGRFVKPYCEANKIAHDIAWSEEARIYGPKWYEFISSCRSMLGSESGSNVFDWDGKLVEKLKEVRAGNPHATDDEIYAEYIQSLEMPGLMNQISPKVFEAIAYRTVLVLYEGDYSNIVKPGKHYIALKKNGSNLDEVFRLLADGSYVDAITEKAYQDIIESGRYSYQSFAKLVDKEIERSFLMLERNKTKIGPSGTSTVINQPTPITTAPILADTPDLPLPALNTSLRNLYYVNVLKNSALRFAFYLWSKLPISIRNYLKPILKPMLRRTD